MARPIWKSSVSFGLVTIPMSLYPSGETAEEIGVRLEASFYDGWAAVSEGGPNTVRRNSLV